MHVAIQSVGGASLHRLHVFVRKHRLTIRKVSFENLRPVPFTQLANLTGVPAMSLPLHTFADGMPLGVQFLAAHGGEGALFSLAAQLERAAPWSERRPSLQ